MLAGFIGMQAATKRQRRAPVRRRAPSGQPARALLGGVQWWRRHGPVGGQPGAPGCGHLLACHLRQARTRPAIINGFAMGAIIHRSLLPGWAAVSITKAADVGRRPGGQGGGRHPRGRPAQSRVSLPITSATTWAMWPAWGPISSSRTWAPSSPPSPSARHGSSSDALGKLMKPRSRRHPTRATVQGLSHGPAVASWQLVGLVASLVGNQFR